MKQKQSLALLMCRLSLVLGLLILVALFDLQAKPASAASSSFVRIVHASPDIGTADVFLDGTKLLSNFAFGTATDYAAIPPGPHTVQVALIGKGTGAAVITQTLTINPGVAYTVAAIGATPSDLALQVFIDNNLLSTGMAKVRIYHLSPGTGTVTVSVNGKNVVTGLGYRQASSYFNESAGSYTLDLTATQPPITLPLSTTLKANTVTSVFAVGMVNGNPKIQFVSSQAPGIPGLPPTGSDPNPAAAQGNTPPLIVWPWLLAILALAAIGASLITRRVLTHQKTQ